MKPKMFFTSKSLSLILEALGYNVYSEGYVMDNENKIYKDDILGFQKQNGIITK